MSLGINSLGSGGLGAGDNLYAGIVSGGIVYNGRLIDGILKANEVGDGFWPANDQIFWQDESSNFYADLYVQMRYETPIITPSKAALGSKMTLSTDMSGDGQFIQYRYGQPDPMFSSNDLEPFWNVDENVPFYMERSFATIPYQTWPGQIVASNWVYQFLVTINGGRSQGLIREFDIEIDVPDIQIRLNDIVVPVGGGRLPIGNHILTKITNVQLTLQADGGTAQRIKLVDKNHSDGPMVICEDETGTSVVGTIDAVIQAY